MTVRKTTIGAVAGVCLSAVSAAAADLPTRAPPPVFVPPPPLFTWTGFYIGGYGGGSFEGNVRLTATIGNVSLKRSGFTGGGLAGYNYQIGRVVVGLEGDGGYDGEKGSATFRVPAALGGFPIRVQEKSDGFVARVRGRVGFAMGNFLFGETLIFAAGGGSYLNERFTFNALGVTLNTNKDRTGYNIGGGIEIAFTPNWIARAEYIYDDFGTKNYGALAAGIPFRAKLNDNTARGALIYKF